MAIGPCHYALSAALVVSAACEERAQAPANMTTNGAVAAADNVATATELVEEAPPVLINPAKIYASMGPSVAHIEANGELFNGEQEFSTGTGFMFRRDGYLLTCKHVIPLPTNYRNTVISVRFGSSTAQTREAKLVWMADKLDLAVIKVEPFLPRPTPVPLANKLLAPGNDVAVLGFPVNLDLNITRGIVSGPAGDGRYVMDATINPGNSGGPVFGPGGSAIGVAWGAALKWKVGEEVVDIQGVRFFIPAAAVLAALPQELLPPNDVGLGAAFGNASAIPLPQSLKRAETVEFIKDDHPVMFGPHSRRYKKILSADPGYEIIEANVSVISSNHASPAQVSIEGDRAIVSSDLQSGPQVDRWRGWLMVTVELKQRLKAA